MIVAALSVVRNAGFRLIASGAGCREGSERLSEGAGGGRHETAPYQAAHLPDNVGRVSQPAMTEEAPLGSKAEVEAKPPLGRKERLPQKDGLQPEGGAVMMGWGLFQGAGGQQPSRSGDDAGALSSPPGSPGPDLLRPLRRCRPVPIRQATFTPLPCYGMHCLPRRANADPMTGSLPRWPNIDRPQAHRTGEPSGESPSPPLSAV